MNCLTKTLLILASLFITSGKSQKLNSESTGDKSFNLEGFFFDDFQDLPEESRGNSKVFRYSLHSVLGDSSITIEEINNVEALKLTLFPKQLHKQAKGYRSEIALVGGNPTNKEEWFEFSFMIPKSNVLDSVNIGKEVSIAQFHSGKPKNGIQPFNRPSIQFLYLEQYEKKMILLRYGWNGIEGGIHEGHKWNLVALEEIKHGKWYKLRVNIHWSLSNTGYIAVWLNNKPLTPYNGVNNRVYGANMHNQRQSYLKLGYYRYWDNSSPTSIYFDYIKVARSFLDLTGKDPTVEELYGKKSDFRYLINKKNVLSDINTRED